MKLAVDVDLESLGDWYARSALGLQTFGISYPAAETSHSGRSAPVYTKSCLEFLILQFC